MYAIRSYYVVQGGLVLEEYDLAVGLAAELQADGDLGHRGRADQLALLEDLAIAVGAAYPDAALADGRITSYNVCYTKLLRLIASFFLPPGEKGWRLAGRDPPTFRC